MADLGQHGPNWDRPRDERPDPLRRGRLAPGHPRYLPREPFLSQYARLGPGRDARRKPLKIQPKKVDLLKLQLTAEQGFVLSRIDRPMTLADYDKVKDLADATFDILGLSNDFKPMSEATLRVHKADGTSFDIPLVVRIDTPVEIDYYRAGGILPYVLAQILRANG